MGNCFHVCWTCVANTGREQSQIFETGQVNFFATSGCDLNAIIGLVYELFAYGIDLTSIEKFNSMVFAMVFRFDKSLVAINYFIELVQIENMYATYKDIRYKIKQTGSQKKIYV
jgi:hypothetical protein